MLNEYIISLCFEDNGARISADLPIDGYDKDLEYKKDYQFSIASVYRPYHSNALSDWILYRGLDGFDKIWDRLPTEFVYLPNGDIEIDGSVYTELGPVATGINIVPCVTEGEYYVYATGASDNGNLEWVFQLEDGSYKVKFEAGRRVRIDFEFVNAQVINMDYHRDYGFFPWNLDDES